LPEKTAGFTKHPAAAFPHPSSLRRTGQYASLLRTSEALHPGIFEQPCLANPLKPDAAGDALHRTQ
jgi:hypothetical protein